MRQLLPVLSLTLSCMAFAGGPTIHAHGLEQPDPQRWLERLRDPDVEAWWEARDAATRAWTGEELPAAIQAATKYLEETRVVPPRLVDHRSGVSLWRTYTQLPPAEVDPDEPKKSPRPRWRSSLYVQAPGQELPGTLITVAEPEEPLCVHQLSPDGTALIWGTTTPKDPHDEEAPRLCRSSYQGPGSEPEPLLEGRGLRVSWGLDGRLLLGHHDGKRAMLSEVFVDGASPIERYRGRRRVDAWWLPDGTVLGSSSRSTGGKQRSTRLIHGRVDELQWLGAGPFWPWLGENPRVTGLYQGEVLLMTEAWSPGYELVRIDPDEPFQRDWRTLLAERPGMDLANVRLHGDDLLMVFDRDGWQHLESRPWQGGPGERVELGGPWTHISVWRTSEPHAVITANSSVARTSWSRSPDGQLVELPGAWLREGFLQGSAMVPSTHGAQVPVSWIRPAQLVPGTAAPVWLRVYGGFGSSQRLRMTHEQELFVRAGGIVGVIHARGGTERGELWHEDARLEHFDRTFDDVVAAAQWFVDQGWSTAGRIAIQGASNGGLTVAASIARRPDLFGAGVAQSGVMDLLRARRIGNWWPREYGTLRDEAQRARLVAESPVHRRPAGTLPPLLVVTGQRDPVVTPIHSYKLVGAWSELDGGPVLLRVDRFGSHGAKPPRNMEFGAEDYDAARSETLAFLFRALEMTVPDIGQPAPADPAAPVPTTGAVRSGSESEPLSGDLASTSPLVADEAVPLTVSTEEGTPTQPQAVAEPEDECIRARAVLQADSEEEISADALPCQVALDLDGDGRSETLSLMLDPKGERAGARIHWGHGGTTQWGAGVDPELLPGDEEARGLGEDPVDDRLAGIVHWRQVPVVEGRIQVALGAPIAAPAGIEGDALLVSGTDAAILVYRVSGRFRWVHLGY